MHIPASEFEVRDAAVRQAKALENLVEVVGDIRDEHNARLEEIGNQVSKLSYAIESIAESLGTLADSMAQIGDDSWRKSIFHTPREAFRAP